MSFNVSEDTMNQDCRLGLPVLSAKNPMDFEPSLGGGSLLKSFFQSIMRQPQKVPSPGSSLELTPSVTLVREVTVQQQAATITPVAELRPRNPIPQQDADCQQASQSAQQAIQQASQSASQSIQQASQSASEAARQASQSASQAIQQAQNSAAQSISAASRSASSAMSSASSVVQSIQSSASAAISSANNMMNLAQASATTVQVEASKAILQAGAAVAAATGSAAAAGSSFLQAAAKATASADASVSAIGAAASSSVQQASQQVTASQNAAVTATQAALAIVGSIIASALITILIYFLIMRHKKKAKQRSRGARPPSPEYSADPKFPVSEQVATTIAPSQPAYTATRTEPGSGSQASFSLFPKTTSGKSFQDPDLKTTSVAWDPSKPPKAPSLNSWLKAQDAVSPFGSIKLPTDSKSSLPLGGQLKSPLRSIGQPQSPNPISSLPTREPTLPVVNDNATAARKPSDSPPRRPIDSEKRGSSPHLRYPEEKYRESKASVWTDDIPDSGPSPPLQSPPKGLASVTRGPEMKLPTPTRPVRNTAEWMEQMRNNASPAPSYQNSRNSRPSLGMGLPRNPRGGGGGLRLPPRLGANRQVQSVEGELGYVQGLNRFLPNGRASTLSRMGSDRSTPTPGVGKAM